MKLIPLFPLQLVIFPNEMLPLHIFEPRYKEMISDCLKTGEPLGILSYIEQNISKIGCLCTIETVSKVYEDGKYDIVCRAGDRFLTHSFNSSKSYLQGSISLFHDLETQTPVDSALMERVISKYEKLIEIASQSWEDAPSQKPINSFELGHLVGFNLAQKQNLLEIKSESNRLLYIDEHLDRIVPQMEAFEQVKTRIKSNGHFREFPPLQFKIDS